MPKFVLNRSEFISTLAIYNKGCANANSVRIVDNVLSGWTAYSSTLDGITVGVSNIPTGQVILTSSDIGTIKAKEYRIFSYKVLPPITLNEFGTFRYNLTWGSRNNYEENEFIVNTTKYSSESHLLFNINAINSFKARSAEKDENQLYEFNFTNIGDFDILNNTWNVTLILPAQCNPSNYTGNYNSSIRQINWPVGVLNKGETGSFYLNLDCSQEGKYVLVAEGIHDTRSTNYFVNNTNIGCVGTNCKDSENFVFSKPNNSRYEKLSKIDFYTSYGWSDYGLTIGEGLVNFTNDNNEELIVWQNYSLNDYFGAGWFNYTINESEQNKFVNAQRTINVKSYTDGIGDKNGNVTVEKIAYTWENGKLFEDLQNLFLDVHPFIFDLPTPVLQAPINNSLQAATPVGLSWQSITPPENVNITYYVFGDTLNATTFLDTTTEALYLWRDIGSATYYWKVIASDGITNTTSNIWQFNLDVCQPDTGFSYALNYPMSYNPATDTITVWGDNGIGGREVMGNNESNAITFEQIYEFGRAVRGICAVIKPAEGSYAVLSRLELGNVTSPLNTTFVKTTGQAVDFGKQLQINFNATLISGQLSQEGSPFGGSTLSFSGLDAVDANEGEFYLLAGSKLKLYDSGVSHKVSSNDSNPFRLYWNGEVLIKSSTLQNWFTIRFLGNNNSLEDLIITNVGEGFYPAVSQVGNLNSITARKTLEDGIYFFNDTNITIVNLEVSETNGSDIKVLNYTGNAILLNPTLDWGSINWTSGSYSGEIRRVYSYDLKTTDSAGANLENTTTVLLDTKGDVIFSLMTDSLGIIPQKLITRGLFDYVYKTGNEQGPHTLYIKKYGKNFQSIAKEFSAATIETIQLAENAFTSFSVSEVAVLSNITYNLPTKVSYGEEDHNSFEFSGQLNNYPIDQCQFFALFANDTKLVEGSTKNYTINYETGVITFIQNMSDYIIRPVYYYGGNLTLTNGLTVANAFSLNDLYDYMQYQTAQNNLTTDLKTVDGITYSFCIDLVVGNENSAGSIVDAGKTTEFNLGYDIVQGAAGSLIDLAGVGGTGTIGAIEVSRKEINSGQNQTIFVSLADNLGNPITSREISASILYPNGSLWFNSGLFNEISGLGIYNYNFLIPSGHSPYGIYAVIVSSLGIREVRTFDYVPLLNASAILPLNVFSGVGSGYNPGDNVYVLSTSVNENSQLVNSTINISVYYPNNTLLSYGVSTILSQGRFAYNFILPNNAIEGTYRVDIDAIYLGNEFHETLVFQIKTEVAGVSYPQIYLESSTPILAGSNAVIGAQVVSSTGGLINCDGELNVTIIDLADGSVKNSGSMTNFGNGLYNYSWITPVTPSVYYANVSCNILSNSYAGFTLISTQPVGAGLVIDYNELATYVWNYSSRNLTYYNQSVAENLLSCFKDAQCSEWWINTTLSNLKITLDEINLTTNNIESNSQSLINYFDCSINNEICDRLQNISDKAVETNAIVLTLNNSQIPQLQTDIDNIYQNIQWLTENVATQSNISFVLNGINNLETNISFIKNNLFTQGNATSAFLVDYISTVYTQFGGTAELWVLANDLLGNSKFIENATCEIKKGNQFIANAVTSINDGGVYAYWDVSNDVSSGAYYWNCTLTGSTVNIYVPFYVSGAFEITSLVTSSPKYPNEATIIEATFADQNGNDVIPDTINLNILQPPTYLTSWTTANKGNFVESNNVWRYVKSIESNPTTGTYIVQMTASYNGINNSKTMQFRIATGGPYMVVLECPDSSIVGSNLNCNVKILDEGEAATESTCDVWVDINNNLVIDGSEPQTQFSKETVPLENVTQAVSLNVLLNNPVGSYVVRTTCSYANSGQPDSTASDFVLFTSPEVVLTPPSTGGGGGGGGVAVTPIITLVKDFWVDSENIKVSLKPGEVKKGKLTLKNIGNGELDIVINNTLLKDFVFIRESQFSLDEDELKVLELDFIVSENVNPGLYVGKLIISADNLIKEVLIAINVESKDSLFDVNVVIPSQFKSLFPGEELLAKVEIINLGEIENVDADIRYVVKNDEGVEILSDSESLKISRRADLVKTIILPKDILSGTYALYVEVIYDDKIASSTEFFNVKRTIPWLIVIILISLIIFLFLLIIFCKRRKKKGYNWCFFKKKKKSFKQRSLISNDKWLRKRRF
ncbi:MAG TPA: hypothetical protein HA283_04595 [Nanoarchaeota archaeon]|nr:hypothetical protein [Nanoarchaeota archaeon]HIH63547.1 hypothetical protein [Nanoarchaeota archaeon]HIJ09354.1 hypothetical protein [Nanoarchaeota archaeon]